jgi:hypothetical protein
MLCSESGVWSLAVWQSGSLESGVCRQRQREARRGTARAPDGWRDGPLDGTALPFIALPCLALPCPSVLSHRLASVRLLCLAASVASCLSLSLLFFSHLNTTSPLGLLLLLLRSSVHPRRVPSLRNQSLPVCSPTYWPIVGLLISPPSAAAASTSARVKPDSRRLALRHFDLNLRRGASLDNIAFAAPTSNPSSARQRCLFFALQADRDKIAERAHPLLLHPHSKKDERLKDKNRFCTLSVMMP